VRLLIPCMECLKDLGRADEWLARVEFRDDGRYEVLCPRGHRSVTILQQAKYEVLFEIGVNAILDGYYREAVASFAAAVERFYEFAAAALLEEANIQRDHVLASWRLISTSSERQLGAFIFLWLSRFNETPNVLRDQVVGFRNNVVHKGKIPSKEEAISFGDAVLAVVLPKLDRMKQELQESVHKATFYTLKERRTLADADSQVSTMFVPTFFARDRSNPEAAFSVSDYLAEVAKARAIVQAAGI
jgi:hypothetical protein